MNQPTSSRKTTKVTETVAALRVALATLRLEVTAMKHDLECTKRERDSLIAGVRYELDSDVTFDMYGNACL
jgi:hypothetical protein